MISDDINNHAEPFPDKHRRHGHNETAQQRQKTLGNSTDDYHANRHQHITINSDDDSNFNDTNNENNNPTHKNILLCNQLIGSTTMAYAINKLRGITDDNTYIVEPDAMLLTMNFNNHGNE